MIQIFGTKKCRDTGKALRYFKERGVDVQFRDIVEKAPSPGELDDVARAVGGFDELIDLAGAAASARGLAYMEFDPREELLRDAKLLKTPLVRAGRGKASVGVDERKWAEFAASEKG